MKRKKCPSCDGEDHSRSSSHLCRNQNIREGKELEKMEKKNYYAIKSGITRFIKDQKLYDEIQNQVVNATKMAFWASRFLNYYIQKCLEGSIEIPKLDNNFIRSFFTRKKLHEFSIKMLENFDFPKPDKVNTNIITYLVKEYKVNLDLHIDQNFILVHKKYMNKMNQIKKIKLNKKKLKKDELFILEIPDPKTLEQNQKFKIIWEYNERLSKFEGDLKAKICSMVPLYTTRSKYITIDTDILFHITKSNGTKFEFGNNQIEKWKEFTNIKQKYISTKENKNHCFNFMIKTDGLGMSMIMFRKQKMNEKGSKIAKIDPYYGVEPDPVFIGIDVGKKDICTAMIDGSDKPLNYSSRQLYHEAKYFYRTREMNKRIKTFPHFNNEQMPTSKCHGSDIFLIYLKHLDTYKEELEGIFDLYQSKVVKRLRIKCDIEKSKSMDRYCNKLFEGQDKSKIVIGYGDASCTRNMNGHLSSLKGNWIYHKLKYVHKVKVIYIKEYNTSQVCSHCHNKEKLVKVGSSLDPYDDCTREVAKPHFIRRCTSCRMIWNRDVNAAINIRELCRNEYLGHERLEIFRTQLEKPDVCR